MNPAIETQITPATPADASSIEALLKAAELPSQDFRPHLARFLVAKRGGALVGVIGAEVVGPDALLRSLAVEAGQRRAGLGGKLVDALEAAAGSWGVERWWLLTTTARDFFGRRGFRAAKRTEAPAGIQQTGQFSGGCCCSAICLTRERRTA